MPRRRSRKPESGKGESPAKKAPRRKKKAEVPEDEQLKADFEEVRAEVKKRLKEEEKPK